MKRRVIFGGTSFGIWLWLKIVMGSHFGVGEFTTHFRTYFSGWIESDVHWGYGFFGF